MRALTVTTTAALSLLGCKPDAERKPDVEPSALPAPPEPKPEPKPEPAAKPELAPASAASIALADTFDAARFEADLRMIAAERAPGTAHWQAVQDRCFEVLDAAGFAPVRFEVDGAGISVIGRKDGTAPELPSVVVGAHYDHIAGCPGADDNASGTAAVLELARLLGSREWKRTLTIACWDEEESGLNGSRVWADAAAADGREFALYLNFDAIAYADSKPNTQTFPPGVGLLFGEQIKQLEARELRADFIALLANVGAAPSSARLLAHANRLELPVALLEVPDALINEDALRDLRRSDHANFWQHGVPAVFMSDTANFRTDTYHCQGRPDTVETLDLVFAGKVVRTAAGALAELLDG
jgi:hypothetical protein